MSTIDLFNIEDSVAIITGGAGMLGLKHAEAIADGGGIPVLWDINEKALSLAVQKLAKLTSKTIHSFTVDICSEKSVKKAFEDTLEAVNRNAKKDSVDILINNAANNPTIAPNQAPSWARLEHFPMTTWENDINVGLRGAMLCSKHIGSHMAGNGKGSIINISSDLGLIAPDQRIYTQEELPADEQPVKPVTYSVVKHGLIGLTKYLATYWAQQGVRANTISPGGVYNGQPEEFVEKLTTLIPMQRMANKDELKAAVLFLASPASSFITGANIVIDGGRCCW